MEEDDLGKYIDLPNRTSILPREKPVYFLLINIDTTSKNNDKMGRISKKERNKKTKKRKISIFKRR
jgi:hypothetical protein